MAQIEFLSVYLRGARLIYVYLLEFVKECKGMQ